MSSNFTPLPSAMFMLILGFKGGKEVQQDEDGRFFKQHSFKIRNSAEAGFVALRWLERLIGVWVLYAEVVAVIGGIASYCDSLCNS